MIFFKLNMVPTTIHKIIIVDGDKLATLHDGMRKAIEKWYRMNAGYKVKI